MRHLIILLALLCVSCNASLPSIKPFKMDIQQGNVVTSKMMLQLKPGMSKSQVRFVMGTPLIQDSFHPDRWDYFYQMRKQGKVIEQRRVTMDFENDALVRIRGDVIPAGSGQSVAEPQAVTPAKNKSKKPKKDKSLLDRLQFWKDDEEVTKPQAAPEDLVTPAAAPAAAESAAPPSKPAAAEPPAEAAPSETTPASEPAPAEAAPASSQPDEQSVVKPALMPAEPAPTPDTGPVDSTTPVETAPEPAPAQQPAPVAEPQPAPVTAPVTVPEPEPATEPQPAASPAPAAAPAAEPETAQPAVKTPAKPAVTEPEPDLPPEDDPSYFERMLEKIGF